MNESDRHRLPKLADKRYIVHIVHIVLMRCPGK